MPWQCMLTGDTCILGTQVDNDNAYNTEETTFVNLLRISLNRATVTAYPMLYHIRFLCQNLFEDSSCGRKPYSMCELGHIIWP